MAKRDLFLIIIVIFGVIFITGCTSNSSNDDSSASSKLDISRMDLSANEEEKNAEKISEAMDIANPETRDGALRLIKSSSSGNYNIDQVIDVWDYVSNHWTYVNDPKASNYYSPASRTTSIGYKGDCDDFAILIGSYIEAIGGKSRIIIAQNKEDGAHAYAEVYATDSKDELREICEEISDKYDKAGVYYYHEENGKYGIKYWLNLDWFGSKPGSEFYPSDEDYYYAYYSDGSYEKLYKSNENSLPILILEKSTPKPTLDLSKLDPPTPKPTLDLSALKTPTPKPTFSMSDLLAM